MRIDATAGQQSITANLQPQANAGTQLQAKTSASPVGADAPSEQPATADLQQAVDKMNQMVQKLATSLSFSVDKSTGIPVVTVTDKATNTVIRQIPSEEVLNVARALDRFQGLLIHNKA